MAIVVDAGTEVSEREETALRERLARALAHEVPALQRLATANTSVTFCVEGEEDLTLLLDRYPPEVVDAGPAEIEIHLSAEQARRFSAGALSVPLEAAEGRIACRGPVRKYLVVDAIVRGLLRNEAG